MEGVQHAGPPGADDRDIRPTTAPTVETDTKLAGPTRELWFMVGVARFGGAKRRLVKPRQQH